MFDLSAEERFARAVSDLRLGLPVVLTGEGDAHLAVAAETLSPARWASMSALEGLTLAITRRRAETLKARVYDTDLARLAVPTGAPSAWVRATADPGADLERPLKGPYASLRDGDPAPARGAIALAKAARLLPAVLLAPIATPPAGASALPLDEITEHGTPALSEIVSARLPMALAEAGRVTLYRPHDGGEEHYAIEIGTRQPGVPVLTRLHSACFTGDVLGSLKCDCGAQLAGALSAMAAAGSGVMLYLNQEGRGIGLANKLRAYRLQDQGFDTVEANHRLGFEDDERDFAIAATMLRALGIDRIRLMTNNPAKIARMERSGIAVAERVPLQVGRTDENAGYLAVKAAKSGHLL